MRTISPDMQRVGHSIHIASLDVEQAFDQLEAEAAERAMPEHDDPVWVVVAGADMRVCSPLVFAGSSYETQTLITKMPVWNEAVESLVLDFKGQPRACHCARSAGHHFYANLALHCVVTDTYTVLWPCVVAGMRLDPWRLVVSYFAQRGWGVHLIPGPKRPTSLGDDSCLPGDHAALNARK